MASAHGFEPWIPSPKGADGYLQDTHSEYLKRERGITEDQIKDAVFTGRSWIQGKGARGGVKWAFEKVIDGDTLRVAGGVKGNAIYIVTAFWVGK